MVKHETLAERREERELEALHGEVAELQAQLQEIRSSINAASSSKEAGGRDAVKTLQVDIEQKEKLVSRVACIGQDTS